MSVSAPDFSMGESMYSTSELLVLVGTLTAIGSAIALLLVAFTGGPS
jgi:hypothetical protein